MTYGHCLRNAVEYSASDGPICSCHCHCNMCRRNSGSSVASFVSFANSGFQITKGKMSDYESSPRVKRSFCDQCGTPMAFHGQKFPEEVHLSPRTLGNPGDYPAQFQVFCATKLPWLSIDDHTQKFETLPTE